VTTFSYFELFKLFKKLLEKKREEIVLLREHYRVGIVKLEHSEIQIQLMQKEMHNLQLKTVVSLNEIDQVVKEIEKDAFEKDQIKEELESEREKIMQIVNQLRQIKEACEHDFNKTLPDLNETIQILDNCLTPQNITGKFFNKI
jgi:hypothetical protein